MRILLDEHYTGLKEYLEVLGWNVTTVHDAKLKGAKDKEIIKFAKEHDLLVVTEDDKSAQIADLLGVKNVWITPGIISKTIDTTIRDKYFGK